MICIITNNDHSGVTNMSIDAKYRTAAPRAEQAATGGLRLPTARCGRNLRSPRNSEGREAMAPTLKCCSRSAIRLAFWEPCGSRQPRRRSSSRQIDGGGDDRYRTSQGRGLRFHRGTGRLFAGLAGTRSQKLVETTHCICPYSNAIKASIDVATTTRG
jgi:hypothetical protein